MILHTCSEAISLSRELENKAAKFYEDLAEKYPAAGDTFLAFAKENKKLFTQIERAYFGVITDAIEGCFAFNIETDKYTLATEVPGTLNEAVKQALKVEETIISYYQDAAEQSGVLMADVPRTFKIVARKRGERKQKLEAILK
jgi:rubrerythrin